ncbi:MAG: septum formation inhibitor [Bacteroidales bacterium]|jgi:cell division protein FtsB|nr:septum formation inhibitor [Bacteroidales bacterium]
MNILREKIESLKVHGKKILSRKYLVTTILFLVWILFFDENSIVSHQRQKQRLREMLQQKEYYIEQIAVDKIKMKELNSGLDNLEKFAREQYYMSAQDEEVFIVAED